MRYFWSLWWYLLEGIAGIFAFPLESGSTSGSESWSKNWEVHWPGYVIASLGFVAVASILAGCMCCRRQRCPKGFQDDEGKVKEFKDGSAAITETTIERVESSSLELEVPRNVGVNTSQRNRIQFEALPFDRIVGGDLRTVGKPKPPSPSLFADENERETNFFREQPCREWFDAGNFHVERERLKYLREIGRGWFGKVVEGTADLGIPEEDSNKKEEEQESKDSIKNPRNVDLSTTNPSKKLEDSGNNAEKLVKNRGIVVRILTEEATTREKAWFLGEATPYLKLNHKNILTLLGACLESDPYLLLFESCPAGDLKGFLRSNRDRGTCETLRKENVPTRMALDIGNALEHMHKHGFAHTDLSARNCLVAPDLSAKLGDYGIGVEKYPGDYYVVGDRALPIRWSAPESLECTETTIETRAITSLANLWSYGILLWEIATWAERPYDDSSDEHVIQMIFSLKTDLIGEKDFGLLLKSLTNDREIPNNFAKALESVWKFSPAERTNLVELREILWNRGIDDFEKRWENLRPNAASLEMRDVENVNAIPVSLREDDVLFRDSVNCDKTSGFPLTDFRLGPVESVVNAARNDGDTKNFCETGSGSETEEESWRGRVERGAYTEKVKQKSKSVADLMILVHIDSDSDAEISLGPQINEKSCKKKYDKRLPSSGSDGDIRSAVLAEEFDEALRKLREPPHGNGICSKTLKNSYENLQFSDNIDKTKLLTLTQQGQTPILRLSFGNNGKTPENRTEERKNDDDLLTHEKIWKKTKTFAPEDSANNAEHREVKDFGIATISDTERKPKSLENDSTRLQEEESARDLESIAKNRVKRDCGIAASSHTENLLKDNSGDLFGVNSASKDSKGPSDNSLNVESSGIRDSTNSRTDTSRIEGHVLRLVSKGDPELPLLRYVPERTSTPKNTVESPDDSRFDSFLVFDEKIAEFSCFSNNFETNDNSESVPRDSVDVKLWNDALAYELEKKNPGYDVDSKIFDESIDSDVSGVKSVMEIDDRIKESSVLQSTSTPESLDSREQFFQHGHREKNTIIGSISAPESPGIGERYSAESSIAGTSENEREAMEEAREPNFFRNNVNLTGKSISAPESPRFRDNSTDDGFKSTKIQTTTTTQQSTTDDLNFYPEKTVNIMEKSVSAPESPRFHVDYSATNLYEDSSTGEDLETSERIIKGSASAPDTPQSRGNYSVGNGDEDSSTGEEIDNAERMIKRSAHENEDEEDRKHLSTPDDERSSDSGFRDKESCEEEESPIPCPAPTSLVLTATVSSIPSSGIAVVPQSSSPLSASAEEEQMRILFELDTILDAEYYGTFHDSDKIVESDALSVNDIELRFDKDDLDKREICYPRANTPKTRSFSESLESTESTEIIDTVRAVSCDPDLLEGINIREIEESSLVEDRKVKGTDEKLKKCEDSFEEKEFHDKFGEDGSFGDICEATEADSISDKKESDKNREDIDFLVDSSSESPIKTDKNNSASLSLGSDKSNANSSNFHEMFDKSNEKNDFLAISKSESQIKTDLSQNTELSMQIKSSDRSSSREGSDSKNISSEILEFTDLADSISESLLKSERNISSDLSLDLRVNNSEISKSLEKEFENTSSESPIKIDHIEDSENRNEIFDNSIKEFEDMTEDSSKNQMNVSSDESSLKTGLQNDSKNSEELCEDPRKSDEESKKDSDNKSKDSSMKTNISKDSKDSIKSNEDSNKREACDGSETEYENSMSESPLKTDRNQTSDVEQWSSRENINENENDDEDSSTMSLRSDNSYVSFGLDEEFVAAIRNELREKLPRAQMPVVEALDPRDDKEPSINDDAESKRWEDEESEDNSERGAAGAVDISIRYNIYGTPLSPIIEERESAGTSESLVTKTDSRDASIASKISALSEDVLVVDTRTNRVVMLEGTTGNDDTRNMQPEDDRDTSHGDFSDEENMEFPQHNLNRSLESKRISTGSGGAPLPSPEEETKWQQQFPLPMQMQDDLMSTSFGTDRDWDSQDDDEGEDEADEADEDEENSSSSGEFVWKRYDESHGDLENVATRSPPSKPRCHDSVGDLDEDADSRGGAGDDEDGDDDVDEEEEEEFTPSAWDATLAPHRSALRSPEKNVKSGDQKKSVWFKKQRYHCVYEYPKETPVAEGQGQPATTWEPTSYADWEEMMDEPRLDVYPMEYDETHRAGDEEFYVSSSNRPFQFQTGDGKYVSQFFPGASTTLLQPLPSSQEPSTTFGRNFGGGGSGGDVVDSPETQTDGNRVGKTSLEPARANGNERNTEIHDNQPSVVQIGATTQLGELRHTRDRLKLNLLTTSGATGSEDANKDAAMENNENCRLKRDDSVELGKNNEATFEESMDNEKTTQVLRINEGKDEKLKEIDTGVGELQENLENSVEIEKKVETLEDSNCDDKLAVTNKGEFDPDEKMNKSIKSVEKMDLSLKESVGPSTEISCDDKLAVTEHDDVFCDERTTETTEKSLFNKDNKEPGKNVAETSDQGDLAVTLDVSEATESTKKQKYEETRDESENAIFGAEKIVDKQNFDMETGKESIIDEETKKIDDQKMLSTEKTKRGEGTSLMTENIVKNNENDKLFVHTWQS